MGLRSRWGGIAIAAIVVQASSPARADDPPPPPEAAPGQPVYPPSAQPPGVPPPYQPPPPPYRPPPPGYAVPVYGPAKITDYDEGQPVPFGYTPISQRRKGMIIAGACLFGATYGYTALGASYAQEIILITGGDTDLTSLWIPVAGPFLEMRETDNSVARFALVIDGLAQTAGALMLVYGATTPRTILVRNDRLTIAPMVRPGASGLVLSGRF